MQDKFKFFCGLIVTCLTVFAHAGSIGGYCGKIDTDTLGDASIVGGYTTLDIVPFVDLYFSGSYVSDFDAFETNVGSSFLGELTKRYEIDDFHLVPLEAGVLVEFGLLDLIEIYCGAGFSYYVLPSFSLQSTNSSFEKDVDISNLIGWWGKAGVAIGVPHLKVFAEAKYTSLDTHNIDIDVQTNSFSYKDTIEIDFSNVQLLVGARLEF